MASSGRGEPVSGSAANIRRWLLVEVSGPWGGRSLPENREVDDEVLRGLQQRARGARARTLLVRRTGGRADGDPLGRRVFIADSTPGRERLLTRRVRDADLKELPLPFDEPGNGWLPIDTLLAVCTQGKHDTCCAVNGRPVAEALAESHPKQTWEVSHIGGDRFAANVLVLPFGHYVGRVPPGLAPQIVERVLAGERPDPYYRGRSCWSMPVQAALAFAGEQLGITSFAGLRPTAAHELEGRRWRVVLEAGEETITVEVERTLGPERSLLTCHATEEKLVPSWRLAELRRGVRAAAGNDAG